MLLVLEHALNAYFCQYFELQAEHHFDRTSLADRSILWRFRRVQRVCSVHVISKHRLSILLALSRLQRSNTLSNHMLMHTALELES